MKTILQKLLSAGFDLNQTAEFTFALTPELTLTITRDENLSDYYIKIQPAGKSILLSAHVKYLNTFESTEVPQFYLSTHDDSLLYFNTGRDIKESQQVLAQINFARQTAVELLVELSKIEVSLTTACEQATKALRVKNAADDVIREEKRLARIEAYKLGKIKRGETLAKEIMLRMENETENEQKTVSIVLELFTKSGFPQQRTLTTVWEKGLISWKRKGNLMDPIEALRLIASVWVAQV